MVEDTHTSYWPPYLAVAPRSIMDFAKDKLDELHEWHRVPDFEAYRTPPDLRIAEPVVSEFCRTTAAIHFYDSMIVFEKGENEPRWRETR